MATADEPTISLCEATPKYSHHVDLRQIANVQRWLLRVIAAAFLSYLFGMFALANGAAIRGIAVDLVAIAAFMVLMVFYIATIVMVIDASVALGMHPFMVTLLGFSALLPYLNLIVLLAVNSRATKVLKQAGIRVGFLGARREDVERVANSSLCSRCGYNLFGNMSGRCPECGREIAVNHV